MDIQVETANPEEQNLLRLKKRSLGFCIFSYLSVNYESK